jgi:hypothetical protein
MFTTVSINDSRSGEIRDTATYRAALWCARVTYVLGLAWLGLLFLVHPSGLVIVLTWLACVPSSVATLVLLLRTGARFARYTSFLHISWRLDSEVMRRFYRDMLWLPRR